MSRTEGLRQFITANLRQSGILIAFVLVFLLSSFLSPTFLSPGNISNIVQQYSYILILAIGMLMVIVAAQIDLSVGSVVALSGAVAAVVVIKAQAPWWVGVLAALAVGLLAGAWQGFWVAVVGIPGFIVTLGGMLIFRGLTYLVLDSISLSPMNKYGDDSYYNINNGFIKGLLPGDGADIFTILVFAAAAAALALIQWRSRRAKLSYNQTVEATWLFVVKVVAMAAVIVALGVELSLARGLPMILIIVAVLFLIYTVVSQRTVFGRGVYAVGGNLTAARLSGVRVRRVNFLVMMNMGLLASIAGIAYSSRMNGAQPSAGNGVELDAIAACFIGGASTTGGIGRIAGAMIGGLLMAIISNIMSLLGVEMQWQNVARGTILLLAVAFDLWNRRRSEAAA